MVVGRKLHPIWTLIASATLVTLGMVLLLIDLPLRGRPWCFSGRGTASGRLHGDAALGSLRERSLYHRNGQTSETGLDLPGSGSDNYRDDPIECGRSADPGIDGGDWTDACLAGLGSLAGFSGAIAAPAAPRLTATGDGLATPPGWVCHSPTQSMVFPELIHSFRTRPRCTGLSSRTLLSWLEAISYTSSMATASVDGRASAIRVIAAPPRKWHVAERRQE
jgi:hypothetical protein